MSLHNSETSTILGVRPYTLPRVRRGHFGKPPRRLIQRSNIIGVEITELHTSYHTSNNRGENLVYFLKSPFLNFKFRNNGKERKVTKDKKRKEHVHINTQKQKEN